MSSSLTSTEIAPAASWQSVAALIDHTLLDPDVTRDQIARACEEAAIYHFATVFVNPCWAPLALDGLRGTGVKVGVPIGFPLGTSSTMNKRQEAFEALKVGAAEIDMVLNVGMLKSGEKEVVERDIAAVVEVVHANGGLLKVILETSLLTLGEKILACQLAMSASADFVKTSTGFSSGGATVEDVVLMRGVVGDKLGVKASGGIRTAAAVTAMLQAGASRIGSSSGVVILRELGAPEGIPGALRASVY